VRIGIFHSDLPRVGKKPGGVTTAVHRLAGALVIRGHEVTVWSFDRAPTDASYRHVQLGAQVWADSQIARASYVPMKLNAADFSRVEVLHIHGDDWLFMRRGLPTVRTLNGSALCEARSATSLKRCGWQYLQFGFELVSCRLATRTYGVGPGVSRPLITHGQLDWGVDLPAVSVLTKADRPTVAFIGTWEGRKRGRLLRDVFERVVRPAVPDAELVMVSDYAEPSPGVRWLAAPTDEEVQALLSVAHVFCLPSSYEGFGIPYLEGMAYGCAVLATDNPGSRHVLGPDLAGQIVSPGALGSEIVRLLLDADHQGAVRKLGLARASKFSWDAAIDAHVAAYSDAIAAWRR